MPRSRAWRRRLRRVAAPGADDDAEETSPWYARAARSRAGFRFRAACAWRPRRRRRSAAGLAAWGMARDGRERSRRRGGGGRRGGDAVDGVGADRRSAGQPAAPAGGAAAGWFASRSCARSPIGRSVAVRGIVVARRTAASALDGRAAVWSLTRFRKGAWLARSFFHEAAFDFLLDDGTDEPIWIEVAGGMLLDRFPPEERVQFHNDDAAGARASVPDAAAARQPGGVGVRDPDPAGRRDRGRRPAVAPSRSDGALAVGARSAAAAHAAIGDARAGHDQEAVVRPDAALARVRRLAPKGPPRSRPASRRCAF